MRGKSLLKTSAISLTLILLFINIALSQDAKDDLTKQAYTFYQQGEFVKAIESAEKVVALEKSNQSNIGVSYVNALVNLARIKQGYLIDLQNKIDDKNLGAREKIEIIGKLSQNAGETEKHLREIIQINESGGRARTAQTAAVKAELASLVQRYNSTGVSSIENSRGRIDEAEKLLAESLETYDQIYGEENDKSLAIVLQSGDFYNKYANYEKALPFYERYIETFKKTPAAKNPELANALRSYASIMFAVFQDEKAADALAALEKITQKKEEIGTDKKYLNLRSKDATAFAARFLQSIESRRKLIGASGTHFQTRPEIIRIPVKVIVDENGKIVEAKAENGDEKLRAKAEREVGKWSVRPFSYQGGHKMRGYLTYLETK